jgi:DNA repair exonuclease SbcCD ATPase subunit
MQFRELEPVVEVSHLRRLLDIQPACVMRLADDGTVLAANDAALALLRADTGAQALGRDLSTWIPPDHRDRWSAFAASVVAGHQASIECDLAEPGGDRMPALLHGVPMTDHPDGVRSIVVAARALSSQRQLEAAIIELEAQLRERDAERIKGQARLAESEARQRELGELVAELEARLRQREAVQADDGQLRQLKADLEARGVALAEAEAARRTADAQASQASADLRQLELALDGFAARQKQMAAERAEERQRLQELSALLAARQEEERAAARGHAEKEQLEARLQDREATVRALESAWREQQAELEALAAQRASLEEALEAAQHAAAVAGQGERDAREAHAAVAAAHAALAAEHKRFIGALRDEAVRLEALACGLSGTGAETMESGQADAPGPGREEGRS